MEKFDTLKEAEKYLENKKTELYKEIEFRGDIVLSDTSFIGSDFSGSDKYVVHMNIWTKQMLEDLQGMKGFDYDKYEYEEKMMRRRLKLKKLYK